ncbi:MAG: hypothetical protein KC619_33460, partial [Myxococcales bacterium]|nr:hypothetical protein [Myxococcales bacterium]
DGQVLCWGDASQHRLGRVSSTGAFEGDPLRPHPVAGLDDATALFTTPTATCATRRTGPPLCWGSDPGALLPVETQGPLVAIETSDAHACGLTRGGRVLCWGGDAFGQTNPASEAREGRSPVDAATYVEGLTDVVDLDVSGHYSCAARRAGPVVCWGSLWAEGRYGNMHWFEPGLIEVQGTDGATRVSTAVRHACAVTASGEVVCWGDNAAGQLGHDEALRASNVAVRVPGVSVATDVVAQETVSCARLASGSTCWGTYDRRRRAPTPIPDGGLVVVSGVPCVRADGRLQCLAPLAEDPALSWSPSPAATAELVAGSATRVCYQGADGLACERRFAHSRLIAAPALRTFDVAESHACGVDANGQGWCWGQDAVSLLGASARRAWPLQLPPAATVGGDDG